MGLALLAWVTQMDRWRGQFTPSSMEGWLNLLLPFSWSYLIALVIYEDPPVGNLQFWVTVPCRWPSLLAAKTLFVLAFIHLPYLVAGVVILWARGFAPFVSIPQLLWKQLLLFAALTLPAAALAAVAGTVAQFMLAALLVGVALVFVSGSTFPWLPVDYVRANLVLLELASAALAIALLQYARRRTLLADSGSLPHWPPAPCMRRCRARPPLPCVARSRRRVQELPFPYISRIPHSHLRMLFAGVLTCQDTG